MTLLVVAAYLLGGAGVGLGLLAVRRGHRLDPRRAWLIGIVLAAGAVLVPPTGSADHINYAAYGRIAAQGGDPYVEAPAHWHGGSRPGHPSGRAAVDRDAQRLRPGGDGAAGRHEPGRR